MAPTRSAVQVALLLYLAAFTKAVPHDTQDEYVNKAAVSLALTDHIHAPYLGCYGDNGHTHILPVGPFGARDMTMAKCESHCHDYSYFGITYGWECYCGNSPPRHSVHESECNHPCAGDDREYCGGKHHMSIWGSPLPSPQHVGKYKYQGCYTDNTADRSLTGLVVRDSAMTLELCAEICDDYSWFGVEYGTQCFCGTSLTSWAWRRPQSECSRRCGGDYWEVCGDADRLNVYWDGVKQTASNPHISGYHYQSCWTDRTSVRSLKGDVLRSNHMTVEKCAEFCDGYDYFGTEYASQCFCGDHLEGFPVPEDQCSELCAGNKHEWCGGPDRLSLYAATRMCDKEGNGEGCEWLQLN